MAALTPDWVVTWVLLAWLAWLTVTSVLGLYREASYLVQRLQYRRALDAWTKAVVGSEYDDNDLRRALTGTGTSRNTQDATQDVRPTSRHRTGGHQARHPRPQAA